MITNKEDEPRLQSIGPEVDYQKVAKLRTVRLKEPVNELNVAIPFVADRAHGQALLLLERMATPGLTFVWN